MMRIRNGLVALALSMTATAWTAAYADTDPNPWPGPAWKVDAKRGVLWKVVQACLQASNDPRQPGNGGNSGSGGGAAASNPCAKVDVPNGYVILKDNNPSSPYEFLLLPTASVTGIEDSRLWVLDGPSYWQYAYENRHYVTDLLKPPKTARIGFAANSIYGRSQDQLHIHIGCVQPQVITVLSRHMDELSATQWTWLPRMLNRKYQYRALLVDQKSLSVTDPFRALAGDVAPDGSMLRHTLFMTAVTLPKGQPGFVLLDTEADDDVRHGRGKEGSNWGSAAELLDLACTADRSAEAPVSK
ncbi:CDP-diacylglycerol diphosphatase [Bordetella flabilis]|uniref:CDP-diacylglycerol pyrophosphatase n=1 Tax=Bordetella flabilis TaxID=463014 RepID=A0A193GCE2_9BORD|nr:CDP-diacylglycerol diphosphatase [Bordetella flabilis]ANN77495.1 hypothetical protein BAU07_10615 [Bordetella flabilis]